MKAVHAFVTERLSPDGETFFYDPLLKHSLKTIEPFTTKTRSTGRAHTEQETTAVFAHLFDARQDTQVARNVLLSYELTSIPRSLADSDGEKHANKKENLLHILSNLATDIIQPQQCTHIIDTMAVVQSISNAAATYSELAVKVFLLMIKGTGNRALVHWIVDTYPEVSIKQAEQSHRENIIGGVMRYTIRSGSQRVPSQLKRALSSRSYKMELVRLFLKTWAEDEYIQHNGDRTVYITAGVECFQLKSVGGYMQCVPQVELACSHEEADTRLLFHANHDSIESYEPILIRSPNTDVLVLAVFICGQDPGSKGMAIYQCAIYHHAIRCPCVQRFAGYARIWGCDSTSQFAGHGKKTTLKLLRKPQTFLRQCAHWDQNSSQLRTHYSKLKVTYV